MKVKDIKKLSQITIENGTVDKKVANYILKKLLRKDIKIYLFYLVREIQKRSVYISSAYKLDDKDRQKISQMFKNHDMHFATDTTLGAGLVIQTNDTIIDASLKGAVQSTIDKLKN